MTIGRKTGGRKAGTPNKLSGNLKEAIVTATIAADGEGGMVGYLTQQAKENPGSFLTLLGKVVPLQIAGDAENPLVLTFTIGGDDKTA